MADLHIISVAVGSSTATDVVELQRRIGAVYGQSKTRPGWWPLVDGSCPPLAYVGFTIKTKPARGEMVGQSIYRVASDTVVCRQKIVAEGPVTDEMDRYWGLAGRHGWCFWLDPKAVLVEPRRYPAFRGWRYLPADMAPPDLVPGADSSDYQVGDGLPPELREELARLCL